MELSMTDDELSPLTVTLSDREDGGISVSCADLPGLILSGSNKAGVIAALPSAIKGLLEYQGFNVISVKHGKPFSEILNSKNPQDVDMHVQHFVVEWKKAA